MQFFDKHYHQLHQPTASQHHHQDTTEMMLMTSNLALDFVTTFSRRSFDGDQGIEM